MRRHHARSHARQVGRLRGAVALAATACGGGGQRRQRRRQPACVSASWGDPQNPLEPANTNEVQGGKVLDMIFRGLKRYDPKTGAAEDMLAETIDDHGLAELHDHGQGRLDLQQRREGHRQVLRRRLELRRAA